MASISKSTASPSKGRELDKSPRPVSRPKSEGGSAAPVSSPRPVPRPADNMSLSKEATDRAAEPAGGLLEGLAQNYGTSATNTAIAERAESLVGSQFKPDLEAQCASFVSDVVGGSGTAPDGFRETVRARDFGDMGAQRIPSMGDLQPGDIVAFNNTYRFSQNEGDHTHVGVYAGEGQFIHRPTSSAGYRPGAAAGEVIKEDLQAYIERDRGRFEASFAGAYRFE